jgi:hypothetical protein
MLPRDRPGWDRDAQPPETAGRQDFAPRKDFQNLWKQKQNRWEGKSKYMEGKSNIFISANQDLSTGCGRQEPKTQKRPFFGRLRRIKSYC